MNLSHRWPSRRLALCRDRIYIFLPVNRWSYRLLVAFASLLGTACPEEPAQPKPPTDEGPPAIVVSIARKDLVFGYRDQATGQLVTTASIAAIPESSRDQVIVTDLSLTPAQRRADRYIYIADVRAARPDGTFPVAVSSRYAFQGAGPAKAAGKPDSERVVVYSASWCGVCRKAKALLNSWNVPFVERDIEASRSAAEELAAKAQKSGVQPSGVPVIDVAGSLLLGLDEGTLRETLAHKGLLPR